MKDRTFLIEINDYQRDALLLALRKRVAIDASSLSKLPGDIEENGLLENTLLIEMLEDIPSVEDRDPGIIHGLCY